MHLENLNLIRRLQTQLPALRKSESKVANFILLDPACMLAMRVSDLAKAVELDALGGT